MLGDVFGEIRLNRHPTVEKQMYDTYMYAVKLYLREHLRSNTSNTSNTDKRIKDNY